MSLMCSVFEIGVPGWNTGYEMRNFLMFIASLHVWSGFNLNRVAKQHTSWVATPQMPKL